MTLEDHNEKAVLPPGVSSSRQHLSDEVLSALRYKILTGEFKPGQHIRAQRIADELQTSATPVREALVTLRSEGFVELLPHRGYVVVPLSPTDLEDLYSAEALLAGELSARAALRITTEELEQLVQRNANLDVAMESGDTAALGREEGRFHLALTRSAKSPKLRWLLQFRLELHPPGVLPGVCDDRGLGGDHAVLPCRAARRPRFAKRRRGPPDHRRTHHPHR